ncbi:GSHPx domain containing protein [Trichuris trichiura]|uniref:GSHPx domain containing protein n=1 Tax=Trichuris trichiura TaxID=36087 RepID=A0A077ZJY1_TRITR|nr:GSHPx domain containing protein [Trichuris trichiura]
MSSSKEASSVYDFTVKDIDSNDVSMERYKLGNISTFMQVSLILVGDECSSLLTWPQNAVIQSVTMNSYSSYTTVIRAKVSLINAAKVCTLQEPKCELEIKKFATETYKVTFDMYSKVDVNGKDAHPLWVYLKDRQGGTLGSFIKWNFTKFLIDRSGQPVKRFGPNEDPEAMEKDIVHLLGVPTSGELQHIQLAIMTANVSGRSVAGHLLFLTLASCAASFEMASPQDASSIYEFNAKDIDFNDVSMERYRGFVVIIVNQLYEEYRESGLRIAAFPCNQFGGQEPKPEAEIKKFATGKYNVTFDMYAKINVNGKDAHPLWVYLKAKQGGTLGSFIKWNFTKFLVDRAGQPVKRFGPKEAPETMRNDIIRLLGSSLNEAE